MKKLAETIRQAALSFGFDNFYVGDPEAGIIEKYIPAHDYYQYIGTIDNFPFISLNFLEKKRYEDKRTEHYIISLGYGDIIATNRINQIFEKETAEAVLVELFNKAVEISNQNLLNITKVGTEYEFSYHEYKGNVSYFFVFLTLEIITR